MGISKCNEMFSKRNMTSKNLDHDEIIGRKVLILNCWFTKFGTKPSWDSH